MVSEKERMDDMNGKRRKRRQDGMRGGRGNEIM